METTLNNIMSQETVELNIKQMNIVVNPSNIDKEDRDWAKLTANVIYEQLIAGGKNANVLASWAFQMPTYCMVVTEDGNMPALAFQVDGLLFQGRVFVVYNAGKDLYDVRYVDASGTIIEATDEEIYFDMLTSSIDAHVERDPMWTDDEYERRWMKSMGMNPESHFHVVAI